MCNVCLSACLSVCMHACLHEYHACMACCKCEAIKRNRLGLLDMGSDFQTL